MTNPKPSKDAPNQLLVEGPDDMHTVINLIQKNNITWTRSDPRIPFIPEVGQEKGGLENLINRLEVLFKRLYSVDEGSLGVIIDADNEPMNHWMKIRDWFERAGREILLPKEPQLGGVVVQLPKRRSRIGIWMMPDNHSAGCLEHFLEKLIPVEDAYWPYAQEVTGEAEKRGAPFGRNKNNNKRKKAEIHTWLAWQEDPGQPFGIALTREVFHYVSPESTQFLAWFRRLFLES